MDFFVFFFFVVVVVVVVVLHHAPAMYLFNHLTIIMGKLFNGINIYYLMGERAIWLDIARVCGRIFTSRRRVKIQHKSAISSHITLSHIK